MQILVLVVDDVDDLRVCVCVRVYIACVPTYFDPSMASRFMVHFLGFLLQPVMSFARLSKSMVNTMTRPQNRDLIC